MKLFVLCASIAFAAPVGDPRIIEAVKAGDKKAVIALLGQKVSGNAAEADGTTALAWAVRSDDLDLATRLIKAGADVKTANRYGVTPLYLAAINGTVPMLDLLLKSGADANATAGEGETALMTAARSGKLDAVKLLIDRGAQLETREPWHGQTALMWAAAQNHPDVVRELLARGADVNSRSNLVKWERQQTSEPRDKWLPPGNLTPLLYAARQGAIDAVRVLVENKADMNASDPDGISPALIAIINGHYDIAAYLAEHGTDVNLADKTGRTALYSAIDFHTMPQSNRPTPKELHNDRSSLDLAKLLLAKGANVNAQLKAQQPYRAKLDRGDDTMLTTGTTSLLRAAKAADVDAIKLLLANGADPKLATRAGINPLMAAAGVGTKEEDTTGRFKTEEQTIEALDLLLTAGLDINAANGNGQTALHGAALWGKDKVVEYLVSKGAKLDSKDRKNLTAYDYAAGKSGGFGFDGSAGEIRESTMVLLKKLETSAR